MKVRLEKWLFGVLLCGLAAWAGASDFNEEAVTLAAPGQALAGTLLLPTHRDRMPVALIIAGSGPTDRDGNSAGISGHNDSLKMLAQALGEAGVASLRYDKRGIGASASASLNEAGLRFDTYVDDAAAWVDKLKADPRFGAVIVIGHSEGSLIGMLAVRRTKASAYVSIAGAADSAQALLRRQLAGKLPPALVTENERILAALERGEFPGAVPPALAALYRPSVQPYLVSWFRYMPTQSLKALDMPILLVQGDTDIQVGVDQARALKAAKADAALAIIPGMNHVLKLVPADPQQQLASYGNPALPLAPKLVSAIVDFLREAHVIAPAN